MAPKTIKVGDEAYALLERGARAVAEGVRGTLGCSGNNVALERRFGPPTITNDGVTIAREIDLKDPFENMGAQLLKEIASKTNEIVGDGTTTAAILGYEIFKRGLKNLAAGTNGMELKRGILKAAKYCVTLLKGLSRPVETPEAIRDVATISANNDDEIGKLISDTIEQVGRDGVISVEESKGTQTEVEITAGLQYDKGFLSAYFMTNSVRQECVLDNPLIFLTDRRIVSVQQEIVPIINAAMELRGEGQPVLPILLIADDFEGEPLATLVLNHRQGVIRCVAVRAPGFGMVRTHMLEDIGILTGADVISAEKGSAIAGILPINLGKAKKVVVKTNSTTIIGGLGDPAAVTARINDLKGLKIDDKHEQLLIDQRIGRLTGGLAVIKAGGSTETEMREQRYRIEDAIFATKAAIAEGILPGGGTSLLKIKNQVEKYCDQLAGDERLGAKIIYDVLEAPFRQICENTGVSADKKLAEIGESVVAIGFNARTGRIGDLYESGVVDPVKVVRYALEHAASVAAMLLSTKVLICAEVPEKTEQQGVRGRK